MKNLLMKKVLLELYQQATLKKHISLLEINYKCPKCKTNVFKEFLPGAGPDKTGKLLDLCRALHAEENAILNLSRNGVRLPDGCTLYSTTYPCNLCANKIVAVGIKKVVYAEPYTMEEAVRTFSKQKIEVQRFQGVKSRAFFKLYD